LYLLIGGALLFLLLCPTALAAQRSLSIERFDARIVVNRNSGLDVTETITARFVGSWNGLYRTIPVDYHTPQGFNWKLGLSLESARDDAGHNLRTATSREGAGKQSRRSRNPSASARPSSGRFFHPTSGPEARPS